jgi:hypothetical protein
VRHDEAAGRLIAGAIKSAVLLRFSGEYAQYALDNIISIRYNTIYIDITQTEKECRMFQLPQVQEIIALRREYREKKDTFISDLLREYGHRLQTDAPLSPNQFRDWLALCVDDGELVPEIWSVVEEELAAYHALHERGVASDTSRWFMACKNGNNFTTFQAEDWEDAKHRIAALQAAVADPGAHFTCSPVNDAQGTRW